MKTARVKDFDPVNLKDAMCYIWTGDGKNPNAALTKFRHLDSASVNYGFIGDYPESDATCGYNNIRLRLRLYTEASRGRIYLSFLKHWVKLHHISKISNRLINKTETFAGPARSKTCDGRAMRERIATSGRPD